MRIEVEFRIPVSPKMPKWSSFGTDALGFRVDPDIGPLQHDDDGLIDGAACWQLRVPHTLGMTSG